MTSKEAMKLACKERGVKEIAETMKLSPTAIYNQINDSSKNDLLNKFVDFANACDNNIPIQWACEELNGVFIENPDVRAHKERLANSYIPNTIKEFGDVITEIGIALEDGRITRKEAERIRKEWEELKILLETFVLACEFGYLEKNDN